MAERKRIDARRYFDQVVDELSKITNSSSVKRAQREAIAWFSNELKASTKFSIEQLLQGRRAIDRLYPGTLVTGIYKSKLYELGVLPYYDAAPMFIILDQQSNGNILGLNIHYLPPVVRARIFKFLIENTRSKVLRHDNRLPVNYAKIGKLAQLRPLQYALKSYIPDRFMSKLVRIQPRDWHHAIMLPTARFVGTSEAAVHKRAPRR